MHHCPDLWRWSRSDSALLGCFNTLQRQREREREVDQLLKSRLLFYHRPGLQNCAPPNCFQKTQGLFVSCWSGKCPVSPCFNKEVDLATCVKRESTEERWRIKRWNLSRFSFFYSHSLCHCDSMCVCMYIHAIFKGSMCSILEQIQCFTQFWTSITQTRQVPSPQIFWPQSGTHVPKHYLDVCITSCG